MIRHVAVVIPANDEEQLIARCLTSVLAACAELAASRPQVSGDVVVVLDACRDGTADVVADVAGIRTVAVDYRCVGRARDTGAGEAVFAGGARGFPADQIWLANTDADSVVPTDWLVRMLDSADGVGTGVSADLVAGTVVPGPELDPVVRAAWSARHDAREGHQHVHGANLGVRASSLALLGGWSPLVTGEDVDLVARAVDAHLTVVRSAGITVQSSARAHGRAAHGFAEYLRELAEMHDGPGTEVTGAA